MPGAPSPLRNSYTIPGSAAGWMTERVPANRNPPFAVGGQKADTFYRGREGALAAAVQAAKVVHRRRPVDADGHAGTRLGKEVEKLAGQEGAVGLNADGMALGGEPCPETAEQRSERVGSEQQGLAPVQDDREPGLLAFGLLDESVTESPSPPRGACAWAEGATWCPAPYTRSSRSSRSCTDSQS